MKSGLHTLNKEDRHDYFMVGTNDLAGSLASAHYDAVFEPPLPANRRCQGRYAGYGLPEKPEESFFYVTGPADRQPATAGNGTMIAFPTLGHWKETLHEVYQIALKSGGMDEGALDLHDDSPTHYAYVRDPAGNKLAFYCDNVES